MQRGKRVCQEEGTAHAKVRSVTPAGAAGLGVVEELLGGEAGGGSGCR